MNLILRDKLYKVHFFQFHWLAHPQWTWRFLRNKGTRSKFHKVNINLHNEEYRVHFFNFHD